MRRALMCTVMLACVPSPTSPSDDQLGRDGVCLEDLQCPADQLCRQGQCVDGDCFNDGDCLAGEVCERSRCLPVDVDDCSITGCPSGQVCHTQLRRCVEPLAQGCQSDRDCSVSEVCDVPSGRCSPAMGSTCANDDDCPLHARCEAIDSSARRCVEFDCQSDADCAVRSARCDRRSRRCLPQSGQGCEVDSDCPTHDGKMSWCNRRERRCFSVDEEEFCLDDWACGPGERCDREASQCIPINSCTEDLECPPRHRCQSSRCLVTQTGDRCDHHSVCPINDRCLNGRCQRP